MVLHWRRSSIPQCKTVGLPVALATLLILVVKSTTPGVTIAYSQREIIRTYFKELEDYGVIFKIAMPYLGYNPDKESS
jgi:hypothetical protein